MAPWTLENTTETLGKTFTRPLGTNELGFYYDACFNSTADMITSAVVEALGPRGEEIFDQQNISRAWIAVKQRHPLLGAKIRGEFGTDAVQFMVSEKSLAQTDEKELIYMTSGSDSESSRILYDILYLHGPQRDLHETPVRLIIIRHLYVPHRCHIVVNAAHFMTDAMSAASYISTLFDILTLPTSPEVPDLSGRLAMVVSSEDLNPTRKLRLPQQRWRYAIAGVIHSIRNATIQGGFPLPRTLTPRTYITPAKGRDKSILTATGLAHILAQCQEHKFSIGCAVAVLSQLATSRILWRRRLAGEYSDREWDFILKQPTHTRGPVNIRGYLDKEWQHKGGNNVTFIATAYFSNTLPCLPGPGHRSLSASDLDGGAPSYALLLPRSRFYHRCKMIKAQMRHQLTHPLFLDIGEHGQRAFFANKKKTYMQWSALRDDKNKSPIHDEPNRPIYTSEWTSIGNLDDIVSRAYPLPSSHRLSSQQYLSPNSSMGSCDNGKILMRMVDVHSWVHARPTDFFLSTTGISSLNSIELHLLWDQNVYAEEVMEEWLDEVRSAFEWYFGSVSQAKGKL